MITQKSLIIYYFSGTGNSRNVALWLSNAAREHGLACRLVNIAHTDRLSIQPPEADALVAFISPIHGFNYAPVMMYFIMRFPKGGNSVLLMNTRAGMLVGRWITPGLTGIAFYLSSLVLLLKGYSIRAMFPVDLPSNWISLHPGLNERTVRYLHERNKERVADFAKKIFSGKRVYKSLREILQDVLIAPIAAAYFFMGRFILAKTFYATSQCDACQVCVKHCPVKAITMVDNRPFWTIHCESCMKCMSTCPRKAIETGHGFISIVSAIYALLMVGLLRKFMDMLPLVLHNGMLRFIAENALFLALMAGGYRLIHYGMRFTAVERLMAYTSLTWYTFWGRRYKALKD